MHIEQSRKLCVDFREMTTFLLSLCDIETSVIQDGCSVKSHMEPVQHQVRMPSKIYFTIHPSNNSTNSRKIQVKNSSTQQL